MKAHEVIIVNAGISGHPFAVNSVTVRPHQEVRGHWDGAKWSMGEAMTRGPTITLPVARRRNLSRRELRASEQARLIVVHSDVPLTRAEREKREVDAFWRMRFDERTRAAQAVVERWNKIRDLRTRAWSKVAFLGEAVNIRERLGSSSLVPIALAEAESAVEEAESFILHEGADRWLGDATWAPRSELRRLQA